MAPLRRESLLNAGSNMPDGAGVERDGRGVGFVIAASVVASAVLVAYHPAGQAHDTAGALQDLARDRIMDAVVYGGMIAVMGVLTLCFTAFAARLGVDRGAVLAGLVAYVIGYIGISGALMTDGLILPAVAGRLLPPDPVTLPVARGILILGGAIIDFLFKFGLAFQAIGVLAWALALLRDAVTRSAAIVGLLVGMGVLVLIALSAAGVFGDPHILIVILGLLALWNIAAAILFIRRTV
jgi:hypothetical protein